jgi:hypothetical protein
MYRWINLRYSCFKKERARHANVENKRETNLRVMGYSNQPADTYKFAKKTIKEQPVNLILILK